MPVEAVVENYYTGHLTAGKKPLVFMVSPKAGGSQYQIACKNGKEKELISYLKKIRQEIFNTEEFDHHWLEEDVQALYREDRRVSTVFTLFLCHFHLCFSSGIVRTFLVRYPPTLPRNSHPESKRSAVTEFIFNFISQIYMGDRRGNAAYRTIILLSHRYLYKGFRC